MAIAPLPNSYRAWLLNEYAKGSIDDNTFKLVERQMPDVTQIPTGHVLVRTQHLAMEPSMKPSISLGKSYREPHKIGDPMWAYGIGEIVASSAKEYSVGKQIVGPLAMQEYALIDTTIPGNATLYEPSIGFEYLSGLGAPGRAAYYGLVDVAKVKEGDVVAVSAAGGATGSAVIQIAKAKGASRIIGIASKSKVQSVLDNGADQCIDYKSPTFVEDLKKATKEQVSLYFDNTGGPITNEMLACMAPHGRVAACGMISGYEGGLSNMTAWKYVISMRLQILGFTVTDCTPAQFMQTTKELFGLILQGVLKTATYNYPEKGVEHCIDALQGLFTGMNTGKMMLTVAE